MYFDMYLAMKSKKYENPFYLRAKVSIPLGVSEPTFKFEYDEDYVTDDMFTMSVTERINR